MLLKEHMKGEGVRRLQRDLVALGYDVGPKGPDGDFGPKTKQAVIAFQQAQGLSPDGEVGPKTAAALAQALAAAGGLPVPNGLAQIQALFGAPRPVLGHNPGAACPLKVDAAWATQNLGMLTISGIPAVTRLYCHRKLHPILKEVFEEIAAAGLAAEIKTAAAFCARYMRGATRGRLSTHCWAIAVDINQASNVRGTRGNMPPGIIEIFRRHGFKWGGDWQGKSCDPMHFQYCTGY